MYGHADVCAGVSVSMQPVQHLWVECATTFWTAVAASFRSEDYSDIVLTGQGTHV